MPKAAQIGLGLLALVMIGVTCGRLVGADFGGALACLVGTGIGVVLQKKAALLK